MTLENVEDADATGVKAEYLIQSGLDFVGTSTSGINQTELAYRESNEFKQLPDWYHYAGTQNISSVAEFVRCCI